MTALLTVALVVLQVPSSVPALAPAIPAVAAAASGDVLTWTSRGNMPAPRFGAAAALAGSFIYVVGGAGFTVSGTSGAVTSAANSVFLGTIHSNGMLGMSTVASMNTARLYPAAIVHDGYLYVFGGYSGGNPPAAGWTAEDSIERAPLNADGSLGAWTTLPTKLSSPRAGMGIFSPAATTARLYLVGGETGFGTTSQVALATVESIDFPSLAGASAGTWRAESSLPGARRGAVTVGIGQRALVTGGFDATGTGNVTKSIFRADVHLLTGDPKTEGTIDWSTLPTQLPVDVGIAQHAAAFNNGFLYVTGGIGNQTDRINWIAVNADQTLSGAWQTYPPPGGPAFGTTTDSPMVSAGALLYYIAHDFSRTGNLEITLERDADLTTSLSHTPEPVMVGHTATTIATVKNLGPDAATNVVATVDVPDGDLPTSVSADQGSCAQSTVGTNIVESCALGSLAAGRSATITLTYAPTVAGIETTTAVATATEVDPNHANDSASDTLTAIQGLVGTAECRTTNGSTVTTILLPGSLVRLYSGSALVATTVANVLDSNAPARYTFNGLAPNATYTVRYAGTVSAALPPTLTLVAVPPPATTVACSVTAHTDAFGGGLVAEPTPLLDRLNHLWFRPFHLHSGVPVQDVIPTPGMSTWYRVTVAPHQRLTFRLTNPPTDYSVLAFTDLFKVARKLKQQGTTLAGLRVLDTTQDRSAPDLDSPDLDSPDLDSPDLDSPDLDSPDLDSPDLDSPDLDSPDLDSPDLDSPDLDSPDLDSPDLDSGGQPVPASTEVVELGSVYVSAQRHGLRSFSAHPGVVPETIVMNTRDYQGDVYFRVRPHAGLSSSDAFTVVATVDGGAGCTTAPLVQRAPVAPAFPAGARSTLVLTNTASGWFTSSGSVRADFLAALGAFAARPEVNGVVADLADDPSLVQAGVDWAAAKTCVAQANTFARSIKQLVDLYRAHYGTQLQYLVMAAPDSGLPLFRAHDDSELSRESRFSGGLDALSASETALVEDYVLTDSYYGAPGPTTRSGHDFYLSDLAIGRLVETPSDITAYLAAYAAAGGGTTVQRAFSAGYGFVSDLATYTTGSLTRAGAAVDTLNSDTWSADDLRGFLFGQRHYQLLSLQGHGRPDRLVPANDGPRLLSTEIATVADGRYAGALVLSLACHLVGFDLLDGEVLSQTNRISFPEAFLSQGATAVGETGFGYGHYPLLKNGEVVFADLADELSYTADLSGNPYGPRGVPIGKALNIAKLRFLNSLADVRGIEAKVVNETIVYGAPMFAVKTANTFGRTPATSAVSPLTSLTPTLWSGDVAQTFTLHQHSLGNGTYYDAGTLDDTATLPFRPIVPAKVVGVQATANGNDVVPRGVVFLGAHYQDVSPFTPAIAVPATQDGVLSPPTGYVSRAFAPGRLVRLDEFAGDAAVFVPFQYRSGPGSARTFSTMTARLYYSTLTGDAALVDAPGIQDVRLSRDVDGGGNPTGLVRVSAVIAGRTTPDVQDVWVTFTATSGPLLGTWKSVALTAGATVAGRAGTFTRAYTGIIDPADGTAVAADPLAVLADVQAVGGNGLVSAATNGGSHYAVVDETATAAQPKRTPALVLAAPQSAAYRARVTVSAQLLNAADGTPINGKRVSFKLGSSYTSGITVNGAVTATLVANAPPDPAPADPYHVTASVEEDLDMLAGGASADLRVTPGPTMLVPVTAPAADYSDGVVVARLALTSRSPAVRLQDEPVVVDLGAPGKITTYTDRDGFVHVDTLDFGGLAPGTYSATLVFRGDNAEHPELSRLAASAALVQILVRPETATVTVETSPESAAAPASIGGTIVQAGPLDTPPDTSRGDITKAVVHYAVRDESGAVVSQGAAGIVPDAAGNGRWSATLTLPPGVYTVDANAAGYFTSPVASALLPIFDPTTFVTGGGSVVTTPTNSVGLITGKKTNFGFNLKYQNGTTTPTGSLLFNAKESNVDLKATTFDWLVITPLANGDRRAELEGSATINGTGTWRFRAIAQDLAAGDAFEIRVWGSSGSFDAPSFSVTGSLAGGSVVIH